MTFNIFQNNGGNGQVGAVSLLESSLYDVIFYHIYNLDYELTE